MSQWSIPFVVRDPDERVDTKSVRELPGFLDGDDADIAREVLKFFRQAALPQTCTVGQAAQVLEDFHPHERKTLLKIARDRAGLPDPDDVDAQRSLDSAQQAARVRSGKTFGRPVRLAYTETGALVDLDEQEAEAARQQTLAESRAAQQQARLTEAQHDAEQKLAHRRAQAEQLRRELPKGVPG